MKVEIEFDDEYINKIASQIKLIAESDYDKMIIEEVRKKCISEKIVIKSDKLEKNSEDLKFSVALLAMCQAEEELERIMK